MKKQKATVNVLAKDGTTFQVEADRLGCFLVHKMQKDYAVTHEPSGVALVQCVKGLLRARKMAAALLSHDLPHGFRFAGDIEALKVMIPEHIWEILKEFNNKAANTAYDPSVRERKAVQTTIFEAMKNEPDNRETQRVDAAEAPRPDDEAGPVTRASAIGHPASVQTGS